MSQHLYTVSRIATPDDCAYKWGKKAAYKFVVEHFAKGQTSVDGILAILRKNWELRRITTPTGKSQALAWKRKYVRIACDQLGLTGRRRKVYILSSTTADRVSYYNGAHWVVNKDAANRYATCKEAALALAANARGYSIEEYVVER